MSETDANELGREVDASMRMFEKSHVGELPALTPIKPSRVLLVLDGSSQDTTTVATIQFLRETFNVETLVLDGREPPTDGSQSTDIVSPILSMVSGSRPLAREPGESYEAILAALKIHSVDLMVLPCPFGRDFKKLGVDSVGTVIDVMLSRSPCPMLVIRRSDQVLADCVREVSVVIGGECDIESKAAAWAFGLAAPRGTVTLNLVVEKEQFENVRMIVEAINENAQFDAKAFTEALTKTHQSLHGAMARTATATGQTYHLLPQAGEKSPPNPLEDTHRKLLVLPLEVDDRYTQGFVQDRIRRSPHPLLIIPNHVPDES
ncbi:MAG: universal stress protein [Planctomycetota bacterium]